MRALGLVPLAVLPLFFPGIDAPAAPGAELPDDAVRVLRICADPDNLPYSTEDGRGFEEEIANLISADLGARVEHTWWAQRRGFFRNTIKQGRCDVVMGVPQDLDAVATTSPYYRSSYVFVTRSDRNLEIGSLDDSRLVTLRIGVPVVGDDGANPEPIHALARRGIIDNVVGFSVLEDRGRTPAALIAVETGEVDVAIAWGPIAGYFAGRFEPPLEIRPIEPSSGDGPSSFSISIGVRRKNPDLLAELDAALDRNRDAIRSILEAHGVPLR